MKINFNAGPAALPQEVLKEASQAVLEYEQSGLSVLSVPHRGKLFENLLNEASSLVLELLGLDDNYSAIWMQGGGRLQFEMIPMNFLAQDATAAYVDSGHWAHDAIQNAYKYGHVDIVGSTRENNYRCVPEVDTIPSNAAYLHLTANNTIFGTQLFNLPDTEVPIIADFSSELFSRKLDYRKFSLIYAVAQKNIGPAGVTLVVAKKSFIENTVRETADILSYQAMAKNNSLINTPPVFSIYVSLLNLRWMKAKGMANIEKESREKADLLYRYIDESELYEAVADKNSRSRMNVCFRLKDESKTKALISFAEEHNITGIAGHRSVGGIRASLYNAIEIEDVMQLIAVLQKFEQ